MKQFAFDCTEGVVDKELENLGPYLRSPAGEDVSAEAYTSMGFEKMHRDAVTHAPLTYKLLTKMVTCFKCRKTEKDPKKNVLIVMGILSYAWSHHRCRLQKLLAIYLKFRGISAKGFDTLHASGLIMRHKWTADAVSHILKHCMDEVIEAMQHFPWTLSDDNVIIPFRIFSQRLENKTEFGSGTAATVYIKCDATPLSENAIKDLKICRTKGAKDPLTEQKIFDLAHTAYSHIYSHTIHRVLQFLLEAHHFDLQTYDGKNSDILKAPTPVDQLPSGPEHITLQYLLGTVNIPEASYEDHKRLIDEFFGQLGWNKAGEKMKLALHSVVA